MTQPDQEHECDLFLLSSSSAYQANHSLARFAREGVSNVHGWGVGSFQNGQARVLRSERPAVDRYADGLSREFAIAINAVSSPVILGHLRYTSRGATRVENNHPFCLSVLGEDWLLIHNGTARNADQLVPSSQRILTESDSDTPRVFEFLAGRVAEYMAASPRHGLVEAWRRGYRDLLDREPDGKLNLVISNGELSFAFIHWRPFYLLHRPKSTGDVALLSTLKFTSGEEWVTITKPANKQAKMLVFSGPHLAWNVDL